MDCPSSEKLRHLGAVFNGQSGRICEVKYDDAVPMFTAWDIGYTDGISTCASNVNDLDVLWYACIMTHPRGLPTVRLRSITMAPRPSIAFYYSISSRYSYLACTQIEQLERETNCEVDWVPVDGTELRAMV